MKLHEISGSNEFLTDPNEISNLLRSWAFQPGSFKIHPDGVVDLYQDFYVEELKITKLPFQLGVVHGDFIADEKLISLKGCPKEVKRHFGINSPKISSFEYFPKIFGRACTITCSGFTSLVGIGDVIDSVNGAFSFDEDAIKTGGLGLLQIQGIKDFGWRAAGINNAFDIIIRYLGTDNIIECQSELIEAGFEEYAVL